MASDLPPYSGNTQCPKCGAWEYAVGTTWHPIGYELDAPCDNYDVFEHLCRVCSRCGYGWLEATADANADAQ
jgi:ribosomal protein S27AE